MPLVWVSIGSNIDAPRNVGEALARLRQSFGALRLSPVYRTVAVGFAGEDFLNLVAGFETDQTVAEVRGKLRQIENDQGRKRDVRKFAPRSIDLDLLVYGNLVDEAEDIPRTEILKYAFVLKPLSDVAPNDQHPTLGSRYADLWQAFTGDKTGLAEVTAELSFLHPR